MSVLSNAGEELPLLIRQIRDRLRAPLPGAEAQATMSPRGRPGKSELEESDCREASVLALVHPADIGPSVVLIERPSHLKKHPGQIAFPGGRREEGESRRDAALRETHEEVGVPPERITLLGSLTPLFIPPSGFCVYPYVGWTARLGTLHLDPAEVQSAFSAPLVAFAGGNSGTIEISGLGRRVPAYHVHGHAIWGATAMMLAEFAAVIEPVLQRSPRGV